MPCLLLINSIIDCRSCKLKYKLGFSYVVLQLMFGIFSGIASHPREISFIHTYLSLWILHTSVLFYIFCPQTMIIIGVATNTIWCLNSLDILSDVCYNLNVTISYWIYLGLFHHRTLYLFYMFFTVLWASMHYLRFCKRRGTYFGTWLAGCKSTLYDFWLAVLKNKSHNI